MTLKEKLSQYAKQEVWEKRNYNAEECEQIADEFAIGFAEWLVYDWHNDERWWIITDRKELLEIYKKEKEL